MATPSIDIYARVSRASDNRERSTQGQVEDCRQRLIAHGLTAGQVHIDSSRSAWNARVRRPGWDALMARLESGATGGVIVFDLARFSRRPIEGERLITAAERGLLILDSEDEYDLTSANGKKAFRDQLAGAAYESDRLSTRVKRGKRLAARAGAAKTSGRPFGFEPDGITIRETEATELRSLAERLLAGESQDAMIRDLNDRSVLTAAGGPWSRTGLQQVLTRPRNAGLITYHDQVVARIPGQPVLDEATWERICSLYASRRSGRPASNAYPCSGIVQCGLCGHVLTGRPRANLRPYDDGSVRRQYLCQRRSRDGGCGRISVDQRELDRHVGALAVEILSDPRHAAAVEAAARATGQARRKLDEELAECEHLADELAGRLGRGEITLTRYDKAVTPLDRRIAGLRAQLADLSVEPTTEVSPEVIVASREEWQGRWTAATVDEQRTLLRQALRGRRLLVLPADRSCPTDVARRIVLDDPVQDRRDSDRSTISATLPS